MTTATQTHNYMPQNQTYTMNQTEAKKKSTLIKKEQKPNISQEEKELLEVTKIIKKYFATFDGAGAIGNGTDGEIHKNDLQRIVDNPKDYPKEVVKAAKKLLTGNAFYELDGADGKQDGFISYKNVKETIKTIQDKAAKNTNKPSDSYKKNAETNKSSDSEEQKELPKVDTTELDNLKFNTGSSELNTMLDDFRSVSKEIKQLWSDYKNTKDPDAKKAILQQITQKQQWKTELNQLMTNLLKMQHQNAMAINRNMV
jgi:hypothetical protein